MATKEITIHRALSELKLYDSRINKEIRNFNPIWMKNKSGIIDSPLADEQKMVKNIQSSYDSILALIKNKQRIKTAIVESNSKTNVVIAGKTMTVADAITIKEIIKFKQSLLEQMKLKSKSVLSEISKRNEQIENSARTLLEKNAGKEGTKVNEEDYKKIVEPLLEANKVTAIDPLVIEEKIKDLEKEILDFTSEVDSVLSESNAVTKITIEI